VISGWLIGFIASSIIIYWGQRFQMLAWMLAWVFAPFSAVYYPVSALPGWAQKIAWCVPTTYIFEGMRKVLIGKEFPWGYFLLSLGWHALYFVLALALFHRMFEKSRKKGLARLE
jgi:ABC-2 type transport system permease protein